MTQMLRRSPALIALFLLISPALSASDSEPSPRLSAAERAELVDLLQGALDQTLALVEPVRGEAWTRRPGADRWSVGEVVEHLVLAEPAVRAQIEQMVAGQVDPDWKEIDETPLATLLEPVTDRSRKFQAPEPIRPSGELSREELLERLRETRRETIEWVRTTDAPLKSHTAPSPFGNAHARRISARAWVAFLAGHNRRHNLQIEEVLATR